nr:amino acid ABC transporter permease [Thomasclavelia spiroformis]
MDEAIERIPATITSLSDNIFVAAKQIFEVYSPLFISGIGSTLTLAFSGTILGLLIGLIIGAIRAIKVEERDSLISKIVKRIVWFITTVYIEIFRGTPMMVQGAFIYYGLKNIVHWSPFTAGVFVITINTGAYMAEIIRSGIQAVDKGQSEAARSIGMNSVQTMLYIVLPQAIKNSFPAIGNEFVINIKDSSVLNVIAVTELFYQAKSVAGSLYAFVPTYFVVALIYLCLTFPTTRILNYIEKRMNRKKAIVFDQEGSVQ